MSNRPMAGTLSLSDDIGVYIQSETVKEHRDVVGNVIFRELIWFTLAERWPGKLKDVRVTFQHEPYNV